MLFFNNFQPWSNYPLLAERGPAPREILVDLLKQPSYNANIPWLLGRQLRSSELVQARTVISICVKYIAARPKASTFI